MCGCGGGGGGGGVIVHFLGKGISVITMTDLICGRIWVTFTYISWGVALRSLPKCLLLFLHALEIYLSPFILRCCRDLVNS